MAGSRWVVAVSPSTIHDLLSRNIYLPQDQLKTLRKMTVRRWRRREMVICTEGRFIRI